MGVSNFVKLFALLVEICCFSDPLLITHGHSDHISGISSLCKDISPCVVYLLEEVVEFYAETCLDDTEDQSPISGGWLVRF